MKQFEEAGAAVIGLSVDSRFALGAWATVMGGIGHPLLADFWPHGEAARKLGVFNDSFGIANRTLMIVDPEGVVRHTEQHTRTLPDPDKALGKLKELQGHA